MKKLPSFNLDTFKAVPGSYLLEASAGTGKTYSLERLVRKLLVEEKIPLEKILVVTFTEKAASELTVRIRHLLAEQKKEDPSLEIETALAEWDSAAIYTIHGFCEKVLRRYPLECGAQIGSEITEGRALVEEAVWDYFRSRQSSMDSRGLHLVRDSAGSFEDFVNLLIDFYQDYAETLFPDTGTSREALIPQLEDLEKAEFLVEEFSEKKGRLYQAVQALVGAIEVEVESIPLTKKALAAFLDAARAFQGASLEEVIDALEEPSSEYTRKIRMLCLVEAVLKPAGDEEGIRFQGLVEGVLEALSPVLLYEEGEVINLLGKLRKFGFLHQTASALKPMIEERKQLEQSLTFDDLIGIVHRTVVPLPGNSYRNPDLAERLGRQYEAVLVDEFQDTDQKQWDLFRTLFHDGRHRLFLIGDPKQSIYGFRKADLEVYYDARDSVPEENRYALDCNYRSLSGVVSGCNAVFQKIFSSGIPGERHLDFSPVRFDGTRSIRLESLPEGGLCVLDIETNGGSLKKEEALLLAMEATAYEAFRLLEEEVILPDGSRRMVRPEDICVLAKTNKECLKMKEVFSAHGILSVITRQKELYQSVEMIWFLALLQALEHPTSSAAAKEVLVSPVFGLDLDRLLDPNTSGVLLDGVREALGEWSRWLEEQGIIPVLSRILHGGIPGIAEGFFYRILKVPGGERSWTNMNHLLEISAQLIREKALDLSGLTRMLLHLRESKEDWDEQLMRLDRDQGAVVIMTMHSSKGLEFPFVFMIGGFSALPTRGDYSFIENKQRKTDYLRLPRHKEPALLYHWEENKRLFYVAFTRAVSRLYLPLVQGYSKGVLFSLLAGASAEEDPLAGFFRGTRLASEGGFPASQVLGGAGAKERTQKCGELLLNALKNMAEREDWLELKTLSALPDFCGRQAESLEPVEFVPEAFPHRAEAALRHPEVYSYTRLAKQNPHSNATGLLTLPEERDVDGEVEPPQPVVESVLPRGPVFGEMVHRLFELTPFEEANTTEEDFVHNLDRIQRIEELIRPFYPFNWKKQATKEVLQMMYRTLSAPLPDGRGGFFSLKEIPPTERTAELEFLARDSEGIPFVEPSGRGKESFLKGFIDLVFRYNERFYILDWKTNDLGTTSEAYDQTSLEVAMLEHRYDLQADIYRNALEAYLSLSHPGYQGEDSWGGVFYVFTRGVDDAGRGIRFFPPDQKKAALREETDE